MGFYLKVLRDVVAFDVFLRPVHEIGQKEDAKLGKIVAIANQKGGVGKTTTVINMGACLAILEKRILLIDADPQANCTSGLGITIPENGYSIYDCIINNVPAREAILPTATPNLS